MSEQYVVDDNLSQVWYRAVRNILAYPGKESVPFTAAITGFHPDGQPYQDAAIAMVLDNYLLQTKRQTVEAVANTIFPWSLWNRAESRAHLFERYRQILPRLQKASSKNHKGLYFQRMITGGSANRENQLDFALNVYQKRKGVRRSTLQIGIFQPAIDHSGAAQMGFPCLQHVTFTPTKKGLHVNAMYASQYLIERAYGNYLGLCRLGAFLAHELDMPLVQVTCLTGVLQMEDDKRDIERLLASIDE